MRAGGPGGADTHRTPAEVLPEVACLRDRLLPACPTRLNDALSQVPEPRNEPVATRTLYSPTADCRGVQSAAGDRVGEAG